MHPIEHNKSNPFLPIKNIKMGESKRRKLLDSNYGKPKSYMSFLELPYTKKLVQRNELKNLVKCLREYVQRHAVYSEVVFDNNERWKKIEKLCHFLGMSKVLDHNPKFYGTNSIFVSASVSEQEVKKLREYYKNLNSTGYTTQPEITLEITKLVLYSGGEHASDRVYQSLRKSEDVKCIYQSDNCVAFGIPSEEFTNLEHIQFFVRVQVIED